MIYVFENKFNDLFPIVVPGVLVNYFVPPGDSRKMARNLAVFAVIMIVLAVNDGMI